MAQVLEKIVEVDDVIIERLSHDVVDEMQVSKCKLVEASFIVCISFHCSQFLQLKSSR